METNQGTDAIHITISRIKSGILVNIRCHPKVEEFFSAGMTAGTASLSSYCKNWKPYLDDDIRIYEMEMPSCAAYSLDSLGGAILGPSTKIPNLSFLRFVGTSREGGVSFVLLGPSSESSIANALTAIAKGCKSFINDYISPITLTINISSSQPL